MKFRFILLPALLGLLATSAFAAAPQTAHKTHRNKANETHHIVKASARPVKSLGHSFKAVGKAIVQGGVTVGTFSFDAFDTMVIDPFGVALQTFADGLDMFIAAPLESLPQPFLAVGDGVHVVYTGLDWAGTQLAK